VSPLNSTRTRPLPPTASRLITPAMSRRKGACDANQAAPRPPAEPPSVEMKRIVWFGRRRPEEAPAGAPYARASWTSIAVPDALSFAPGRFRHCRGEPSRRSSRASVRRPPRRDSAFRLSHVRE
jgi:hypothetical protein